MIRGVLCVDVGTSSMKGGVLDSKGVLISWGRVGLLDRPGADLGAWNPLLWRNAFVDLCRRVLSGGSPEPDNAVAPDSESPGTIDVIGVTISGNGPTLIPLDATGDPTGSAILWLEHQSRKIETEPSFFLPGATWFSREYPEAYERTEHFLTCPGFLNMFLTGLRAAAVPSDEFAPFYWSQDGIRAYGLTEDRFPPLVKMGERVGTVRQEAASATGIGVGTPVFAGGADFLAALIGTGAVLPGRTCDRAGTSEGINYCSRKPLGDPRLRTLPHAIPGLYNAAGILESSGRIFEWYRRITGQQAVPYDEMLIRIAVLPHTADRPRFYPSLHSGATLRFAGGALTRLEADHGPAELGRAVVEAIGFGIKECVQVMGDNGCEITGLRVSGGQARSTVWNRMKANITGVPILVPAVVDSELIGDACCAYTGLGEFTNLSEGAERMVRIVEEYEPDREEFTLFDESYRQYKQDHPEP